MLIGKNKEVNEMELDERKQKILQAIIRNYMETGEPVGSRTISKYSDLNLAPPPYGTKCQTWKRWATSYSPIPRQDEFLPIRATAYT